VSGRWETGFKRRDPARLTNRNKRRVAVLPIHVSEVAGARLRSSACAIPILRASLRFVVRYLPARPSLPPKAERTPLRMPAAESLPH
jgi:hypothetical protein